jgi:hypothetical protein
VCQLNSSHVTEHNLRPATMSQSNIYSVLCVVNTEDVPFPVKIEKSEIIGQLKEEIIKKKRAFANIDSNFLDLYHVDIPDAHKMELKANIDAQTLNFPQLSSKSLINIFPAGPKPDTVHFIVKYSKSSS